MPRIAVDNVEPDISKPVNKPVDESSVEEKKIESKFEKSGNPIFSAFSVLPDAIRFEGETPDEQVLLLLRAHVITNVKWILVTIGLILVPLIIFPILASLNMLSGVGGGTGFVFTIFWLLATFTYAFVNFMYWYFNVYIVTDGRIVDVDWYSIIYHQTNSTKISRIQDVTSTHSGVFASVFDFGNVHIQTAAEESNFEFENVPHPDLVSQKIQELMEKEEKEWEVHPNDF